MFKKKKENPIRCLCCGKSFLPDYSRGYLIGTKEIYDTVFCYDCSQEVIKYFKYRKDPISKIASQMTRTNILPYYEMKKLEEGSKMNRVIVCCECGRKHTIDMKTGKIIEPMKEDEFEVGDIVDAKGVLSDNNLPRGIVTKVCDDSIYVLFADGSCGVHSKKNFRKIGLTAKKTLGWLEEVINAVSTPSPASNGAAYMGNLIDSACRNWSWNECPLRNGK